MKLKDIGKIKFLILFIIVNIVFVFGYIYKQNLIIKISFENQKLEKEKNILLDAINRLKHEIIILENKNQAKNYANKMNMERIKPEQIKQINLD